MCFPQETPFYMSQGQPSRMILGAILQTTK